MGKVARTRRRVGKFKGWRIKVTLYDGRTMIGKNHASDRHMNVILDEAEETRVIKRKGEVHTVTRNLGFVMIRGASVSHIDFAEKPVGKADKKKAAEPKAKMAPNLLNMMPKLPMMPRPGMPPMPGMPRMPMPGMMGMPGMPGMPGMGGMPKMPMPGMPMPGMPGMMPGMMPGKGGMPGMMPGKGGMPGMPGMSGMPNMMGKGKGPGM